MEDQDRRADRGIGRGSSAPKWLADFTTLRGTDWSAQMAASLIFALPAVALFLAFQRRLAGGLAAGAVKG